MTESLAASHAIQFTNNVIKIAKRTKLRFGIHSIVTFTK